ncbi:MAG: alpha/beta fold hydrolase [Kiritimatiellae bacterium]|nr:alpha/beta fold hydrolase [Kiritimatiellia bacterium]
MKKKVAQRIVVASLGVALVLLAALNVLAYKHARAMLQFGGPEGRMRKPEDLSFTEKADALFNGVSIPRPESARKPSELDPNCRELSIESANGATLSAWYVDRGTSTPLVILFHGYCAEKTSLVAEAKALMDLGTSVLLVDFRGSGGSSEAYTTVGMHEADDVAASLAYARAQLEHADIILFGQSMGAAAILRAAYMLQIEPQGVVLEAVFDTMFNTVCNRFEVMHAPSFPSAQLLMFWAGQQWGLNSFAHNPVDYAEALTCPVLFMHGTDDPRAKLEEGQRVFAAAPDPKTFITFEGVGHESYLSHRPQQWKTAVMKLIETATDPD